MSQRFVNIAPEQLHRRIHLNQPVTLVEVRSLAEYRAGHVPGARSIPLDELDRSGLDERLHNPRLQVAGKEEYVTLMNGLVLDNPRLMDVAVPANRRCGLEPATQ